MVCGAQQENFPLRPSPKPISIHPSPSPFGRDIIMKKIFLGGKIIKNIGFQGVKSRCSIYVKNCLSKLVQIFTAGVSLQVLCIVGRNFWKKRFSGGKILKNWRLFKISFQQWLVFFDSYMSAKYHFLTINITPGKYCSVILGVILKMQPPDRKTIEIFYFLGCETYLLTPVENIISY